MKKYILDNNEMQYGGLLGYLKEMDDGFKMGQIWTVAHHLYHYIESPEQTHPYCHFSRMQAHVKKAVNEGYLTKTGSKSATKYNKTEKLKNTEFTGFAIISN